MYEVKKIRGGRRPGAGRPTTDRNNILSVRISKQALDIIKDIKNKSEFIDNLIIESTRIKG